MKTDIYVLYGTNLCPVYGYCKNCGRLLERTYNNEKWQHIESRNKLLPCSNPQREERFNQSELRDKIPFSL
jgi:hypothetical protein